MLCKNINLCGLWRFQPDPSEDGEKVGYYDTKYDFSLWREVFLPCDFDTCSPGLESYEGSAWFMRKITVPSDWQDKKVMIRFQGVNYHAKVWINGKEVGESQDGFLPFEFNIQDVLRFGEENVIVVKADNFRRPGEVPGIQRGWRTYGGILREVEFVSIEPTYIDHLTIIAEPSEYGGEISAGCELVNDTAQEINAEVTLHVIDSEKKILASFTSQPININARSSAMVLLIGQVKGVKAWSPDNPELYTAKVELCQIDQILDENVIRFGFRTIQVQNGKLLLNGNPIYLTGFNRHEDSPKRNMSTDFGIVRRDLIDMKEAGANFVRLCHYPHHPGELDLCDEIGLLAMGEIPLYWWDGNQEGENNCKKKFATAKRQLAKMIKRDVNHPSIIFWSVSNENEEYRSEVAEGNCQLIQFVKELDPTRLAVHVSNHWGQHPNFSEDDVICVNAYPSLDRRGYEGQLSYDLSESTRFWREGLQKLHEQYPDKPILVTEFGYASLEGLYNNGFGEDLQSLAIESEFAGMDAPYVCGATIWCWADHPWPSATFAFCRHLGISPYGVVTRERRKLRAYWTARWMFREKQGYKEIPHTPTREITPAGDNVVMIKPDLLNIPHISFPDGFSIRPMLLDEGGLWTDIERDAEEYFEITDDIFHHEFGRDLQATQWRSFIIVNNKGVGVGTISAWYSRRFKGKDYGQVHWVAIRPAYQGKGLGKAALSYTLDKLAQWHERCFLMTQTKRLNAIKLYLDFGFTPDLDAPGANESWLEVKINLKHPSLDMLL